MKLNFFIGYDSKEDIAYRVCKYSLLKRTNADVNVISLKLDELIAKKLNYTGQINWHMQPKREGEIYWLNSGNKLTQNLYNWTPQVQLEDGLDKTIAIWKDKLK